MNDADRKVIERVADHLRDKVLPTFYGHDDEMSWAVDTDEKELRGLIDRFKSDDLPVAYANASGPNSAPRVKELVWKETDQYGHSSASSSVGLYIATGGGTYFHGIQFKICDTLEQSKVACQADYTRRILSALEGEEL